MNLKLATYNCLTTRSLRKITWSNLCNQRLNLKSNSTPKSILLSSKAERKKETIWVDHTQLVNQISQVAHKHKRWVKKGTQ